MVIITGATGHIGSKIADLLLKKKKPVGVIGRSLERLAPLVQRGAAAFVGTLEDPEFLHQAFVKAKAVFIMIPPHPQAKDFRAYQNRIGESIASALTAAHVKHAVNLSSLGAHLAAGNGPIAGLHDQEQRLNKLKGLAVVHLRPCFFMENLMMNIGLIRDKGINGTPLKGNLKFPASATRDIAQTACEYLLAPATVGASVRELLGQRDLSMEEMTRLLGRAIGKPTLNYVQFSCESTHETLLNMGISEDVARLFIEMYQGINEGRLMTDVARKPENTTATPFEEFAKEFAVAYAATATRL